METVGVMRLGLFYDLSSLFVEDTRIPVFLWLLKEHYSCLQMQPYYLCLSYLKIVN